VKRFIIIFTIPYIYFLKTRLKSKLQKISWFFVYFIPGIILFNYYKPLNNFSHIIICFIGVFVINLFYENGYIENDSKTIKFEKKPQIRINKSEINFISKYFSLVLIFRILIAVIFVIIYYYLTNDFYSTLVLSIVSLLIQIIYIFYNRIRSIVNLFLILPLSFLRFYGFVLPFVPTESFYQFIIIVSFIYPISKTLEFATRKRFKISFFIEYLTDIDKFRILYYFIISIGFYLIQVDGIFIFVGLYYFFFRLLGFLIIRRFCGINSNISTIK
jgi:hypothetical protein